MKDRKFIFASVLVSVFLLTVGLTYAYFSLTVSGNDVAETINVDTTKLELKYTDGKEVKATNIEPGWNMTKTITVENNGNEEAYYTLGWQKLYNEIQKEELVIRSECTSSGATGGTCDNTDNVVVPQTGEVTAETNKVLYPYKEAVLILPGETHTYTVTIEFINYTNKAQNYNQGKKFYGVLGLVEAYNTYNLTLNISNADGTPVANSEVTLHSNPMTGTTDENGTVTFDNVELGDHSLNVVNNENNLNANLNISGGKNEVIRKDDIYKIKPKKENIELDVVVNGTELVNISLKQTLANYVIHNYNDLGLTKIERETAGNQEYATIEYRYQGKTPNNYITFNDETGVWRIIGVFEVETLKAGGVYNKEYKVKIVRDSITETVYDLGSDYKGSNDWTTATLMATLNSEDYYSRKNSYSSNGLTDTAKKYLSSTKWYLGNVIFTSNVGYDNANTVYLQERSSSVHEGNSQIWDGKVGLIYPSDYMYASSNCYNDKDMMGFIPSTTSSAKDYRDNICKDSNWLFNSKSYWTISPSSVNNYSPVNVNSNGSINNISLIFGSCVDCAWAEVRPTLYLDANVGYKSGDGSSDNPFIIN